MNRRKILGIAAAILLLSPFRANGGTRPSIMALGGPNRAAIVFGLGSGQAVVRVVSFEGASISGMELAEASGLPIVAWGNLVCKIGPQGCDNPSTYNECFCRCTGQSGACEFWRYFHWQEGEWQFSGSGAASYAVPADGIDGWVWGDSEARPPSIGPAAIWDTQRLAPGLAQVTAGSGTLDLRVDFQGDENHNAIGIARYRRMGEAWSPDSLSLARLNGGFRGQWSTQLQPGGYEVGVAFSDSDGINGSAIITGTLGVLGTQRICLPMLLSPADASQPTHEE
jgi:hypothetical protein